MDPNANLAEQERILLARVRLYVNSRIHSRAEAGRLTDLRRALFAWLHAGGFQPNWIAYPLAAKHYRLMRASLKRGR